MNNRMGTEEYRELQQANMRYYDRLQAKAEREWADAGYPDSGYSPKYKAKLTAKMEEMDSLWRQFQNGTLQSRKYPSAAPELRWVPVIPFGFRG